MKAQLKHRPQSKKIRTQSGSTTKRGNGILAQEYFKSGKNEQLNKNYERAIELYMLATTCKLSYFQAFCNMGYCYRAINKFNQAKRCYLNSLFINDQDAISHYNLANLYRVMGENQFAIQQYSSVIMLKQKGVDVGNLYINSLINIGVCFKNKGQIEEAIKANQKVLQEDPNQQSAVFNLAVCILNSIETRNRNLFNKYCHERAEQAEALFKRVLQRNPDFFMAKLSLIKIVVIKNSTHENMEKAIKQLKELLQNPKCDAKEQINEEIARFLSNLKKFDESARFYEESIGSITRRGKQNKENMEVNNIFQSFSQENIKDNILDVAFISETEGLALIENGQYQIVQEKIKELGDDNLLKQTLQLILYLKLSEIDEDYLDKAFRVYDKYFNRSVEELPFEKISFEAHKAIGKILSLQSNYEESIKHYEYISQNIKNNRNCASAKLHNELGERFQEVGNRQKALEQYKKGIQIEPDNYSLSYSMGYCLYENGNYPQAAQCFQKIISRLQTDQNLAIQTKELYETDCRIIYALCTSQNADSFEPFTSAYKKLQKLRLNKENNLEMDQQNLLIFFIRISQLYEEKLNSLQSNTLQFKQTAQMLINIYRSLLELHICPDKDEILINCGNLCYQLHEFATAAETYNQISKTSIIPYVNLALCYAHIIEPVLAMKYVQQACIQQPNQIINKFCREVFGWIYSNEHQGEWNKFLPIYKQDLFYQRNEYGIVVLDKLSQAINNSTLNNTNQIEILQSLSKNSSQVKTQNLLLNLKSEKMQLLANKYDFKESSNQKNVLSSQILKICFSKSGNAQKDTKKLINLLYKVPKCGKESQFIEAALYLFVYYNQVDSQKITESLHQISKRKVHYMVINSEKNQPEEQLCSIYPDFQSAKECILMLRQWESLLEKYTSQTLQILEEIYYKGNIAQPLEAQYHFPRHYNLLQSDETFQKFIYIALQVIKYDKKMICKGSNVQEMRSDMIKQFQTHFNRFLKNANLKPINISNKFLPITLYANHESKQDCQQFINQIGRSMKSSVIALSSDCEEVILTVNKLIKVRCQWSNPYEIKQIVEEAVDNIVQNPLFIVNQAILYLQNIRKIIKNDSPEASKYISLDSTLNF